MRAIDNITSSSSLRLGLSFSFLMLVSAAFLTYGMLTGEQVWSFWQRLFGWALIIFLLVSAIASLWIGHYVFSRINRIADTAGKIMSSGDLAERLPIESTWDDLSKLSVVLNGMLDEIEQLLGDVKSVSDNIAHDLRTPLTRLRTQIEGVADPGQRIRLRDEVDGILNVFNALLRIADVEAQKQRREFADVRLDRILHDAIDLYQPLADAKGQVFAADLGECQVHGDQDLLFQAMSNLIDNAIKFTPEGGRIAVSVRTEAGTAHVEICDGGIGIPDAHKNDVTKRFFRVDRSRSAPGNGLGLAMVAAVVELHDATLTLHDARDDPDLPGLCCRMVFALSS